MNDNILKIVDKRILGLVLCLAMASCSSKYLKVENEEQLGKMNEFEDEVKITPVSAQAQIKPEKPETTEKTESPEPGPILPDNETKKETSVKNKTDSKKKKTNKNQLAKGTESITGKDVLPVAAKKREPELEDAEGFSGRRPERDPFRVGEKIVHSVKYFKVNAGELSLSVDPFVEVNGRKSYSFVTRISSGSMFSKFYSVDDRVVTLMDFDLLIPRVFTLHVKETGQLREARSYFDFEKLQAKFWEKKVTEKSGIEEKKQQWAILPFSQNVFSAIFYMRNFAWRDGKEYSFRVADDEENLVFRGKAIRRERIEIEAGKFDAIVIKPEIMTKGVFKPVGDIFIWLSDDDRKFILKIESKIKIGTLLSEATEIVTGG